MATPIAEESTVKEVADWLSRETNIQILSSLHLQTFFDHFYSECDVTKRDWLDLLSILEQVRFCTTMIDSLAKLEIAGIRCDLFERNMIADHATEKVMADPSWHDDPLYYIFLVYGRNWTNLTQIKLLHEF